MVLHEGEVLLPLDASIKGDTDQWPEFALNNVKIVSQQTREPVSLLSAHARSLVVVEGVLEDVDEENESLVLTSTYRNRPITIDNVATYSFSVFEDGSFGFWAAGKAGWFEIKSMAKGYRKIFQDMKEATGMFYHLADKYRNCRTTMPKQSAKKLETHVKIQFKDYPQSTYCQKEYGDDICDRFYHHREFLIKSMLEGQEGLEWKESPALRHFRSKFAEDYAVLNEIVMEAPKGATEAPPEDGPRYEKVYQTVAKSSAPQRPRRESMMNDLTEEEDDDMDSVSSHQQKSVLRPRSSKASKKFMGRQRNSLSIKEEWLYQGNDAEDPDDVGEDEQVPVSPTMSMKNGLTNGTTNGTTKKPQLTANSPKKSEWSTNTGDPLPSYYEPRGPGDTWTCPYDGCVHQVWAARDSSSVDMIKDHFVKTHAGNAEDLINQESRPWVSVDHLLERVKGIASLQAQVAPSQVGLPSRIIRRY
ncbi:hypothetical protein MMC17_000048 [Xylographa soralifera]|nr:hypothetical protein [Xylographa soralifera]